MSTLLEIEAAIGGLSVAELAELERLVQSRLREHRAPVSTETVNSSRTLGLHEGDWSVADDFDAALPEDFWLGTDA